MSSNEIRHEKYSEFLHSIVFSAKTKLWNSTTISQTNAVFFISLNKSLYKNNS